MISLKPGQKATLTLVFTPAKAKPDGIPEWSTSDAAIASITPATDGVSAVVRYVGVGTAVVTATGDKKHGAAVDPFVGTVDVQCNELDVESVSITSGEPEDEAPV